MESEEILDKPCLLDDSCKVHGLPPSAWYVREFVSPREEAALLARVYGAPRPKWTQLAHRRLQNWGGLPTARGMVAERLPAWLAGVVARVHAAGAMGGEGGAAGPAPNHVLVNEYLPGQGILPHVDGALFHPAIATVSLGSHTVLRLGPGRVPGAPPDPGLVLAPRSLLVLREALYARHMHYIEPLAADAVDASLANLPLCPGLAPGAELARGTRVSLTIRHVPKTTTFKIDIGNKK